MTRKTLVSILTLCTIVLISPETAETQEPPTEHNGAAHSQATDAIEQGKEKLLKGDYAGAIADFERVIAMKSGHALAYYARGRVKQALGQHDAAEFDFAKARVLNPHVDKLYPFSNGGEE